MPKPIPYKFRLAYFFAFILAFMVGFPILVFYSAGYSFDNTLGNTFGFSIRGGIYVFTPEPNTSIFVGNELKSVSGFFNKEVLISKLKPDQYLVLAANENFWPWAKLVEVKRGEVEPLFPLLVPKVIQTEEIKKTDSSYEEVLDLFAVNELLTKPTNISKTTIVANGATSTVESITRRDVKIWLEGNTVYGQWIGDEDEAPKYFCVLDILKDDETNCTDQILVFNSFVPIKSFDFYPQRDDAIILALENGIFAIEIDRRTYQNFYPMYRGELPDFRVDRSQIYVKDEGQFFSLDIQP